MNPKQNFIQGLLSNNTPVTAETIKAQRVERIREAIAQNETSIIPDAQKYSSSQNSGVKALGKAMGKYRVTEGELATYAPHYLGRPVSPTEFLKNPQMQDRYMSQKIEHYRSEGYRPEEIADIHNQGIKNAGDPGAMKYQNPDYVNKFNLAYNK